MSSTLESPRKRDTFGMFLLAVLAALAAAAGFAALHFGWFGSPWDLAAWLVVCCAFLVVGLRGGDGAKQGIAKSQWATRADIERADIDEKTPRTLPVTEAGKEGVYLGFFADADGALTLRYKGGKHILSFGPPGANKSTGLVIPNLSHLPRSIVVIDPKAELAAITARKRAKLGRVIILNPFGLFTDGMSYMKSAKWNPLLQLDPASYDFEGDAFCIADALIDKSSAAGNSKFFESSAENLAAALIMWERFSQGDKASLRAIRAAVSSPNAFDAEGKPVGGFLAVLRQMAEAKHVAIKTAGARLLARLTDPKSQANSAQDVIDTFMASTRFLDDPRIGADMARAKPIRFDELHREITTIYLILPAHELVAQAKWLRLFVNVALRELYKNPPAKPTLPPVLFMLDEFGNLGWLSQIETALNLSRGYRIQLWMFLQNLAQLKGSYKEKWESFFTGAGAVTSFNTGDIETAEHLAKTYGNREESVSTVTATSTSVTPQAIPLIRPEDIGRLERGETINLIEPCKMPVKGSAPIYPQTRFADDLDPNTKFH